MDVTRTGDGTWHVTQEAYITDLLGKEPDLKPKKVPITRDQCFDLDGEHDDEQDKAQYLRDAQRCVGELLWTVTRTRPDLMFSIAKLGGAMLRCPKRVVEVSRQVRGYLLATKSEGLKFTADASNQPLCRGVHGRVVR